TQGYAELSALYSLKLKEDATNFKLSSTAENAWKFFEDYNLLWSLRYKGEEQFLEMSNIKSIMGKIKAFNYSAKENIVQDTLNRLNESKFEFTEYEIPKSMQYLSKSVMNCPVNVYVYTQSGKLIAELFDGVESDTTNEYGRFAVVYRPYTGEYAKVICQKTDEKLIIKAEAVSDGLVNFETATVNETNTYTFDNVNITKGSIIKTEDNSTYTIFNDENDEIGTQYTLNEIDQNTYVPVENITINNKTDITLNMGEKYVLDTTVLPTNATNKMVAWISDDDHILTVENGVITALREGTTTIYAYAADGDDIVDCMEISVAPANLILTKNSISVNSSIGQLIVAGYKNDIAEKIELINGYENELSGYDNYEYIKAFLWDNMENISPLCESKTIYINSAQ
ncbi:MAG: Ig-like domain-containing protein, partial [Clostridia bacterium]|nr:Ig-like domain-containing protein [Clostridia bacterium]